MKRKLIFIASALLLVMTLGGCSGTYGNTYLTITPHLEQVAGSDPEEFAAVSNRTELKQELLALIAAGSGGSVLRLVEYSGDPTEDAREVCTEISAKEPLGLFALEKLEYTYVAYQDYGELTVTIRYQCDTSLLSKIEYADSAEELDSRIRSLYASHGTNLLIEAPYEYPEDFDFTDLLTEFYYDMPYCLELPEITVDTWPKAGDYRMIKISLIFKTAGEHLDQMSERINSRIADVYTEPESGETELDSLRKLYDTLMSMSVYLPQLDRVELPISERSTAFNAYGVIVQGSASSEGYALAFKALCDYAGTQSVVVFGQYGGYTHYWNMVHLGNYWYHVDASLDDYFRNYTYFCKTDTEMSATHSWNAADYPVCNGPSIKDLE